METGAKQCKLDPAVAGLLNETADVTVAGIPGLSRCKFCKVATFLGVVSNGIVGVSVTVENPGF